MPRIVVTEFITLDGIIEAPNEWSMSYWNDDIGTFKHDELFEADAQLLGRTEFEVRDSVHRLGARALEAALDERKKGGTRARA